MNHLLAALLLTQVQTSGDVRWRSHLDNRQEFDAFARVGTIPYRLPHLRFTLDRKDGNRIYFYDSKKDRHHRELANASYLSLENSATFFKNNYTKPDRRFVLAWIGYHEPAKAWAFELWEGDNADASLLKLTSTQLATTFFDSVSFKPNSLHQEEQAKIAELKILAVPNAAAKFAPLNLGLSVGILTRNATTPKRNEIVVLDQTPVSLPQCAGIIFSQPTSPLSHLGLLARHWQVPSAYIKQPPQNLIGKVVVYRVAKEAYYLREASDAERAKFETDVKANPPYRVPASNLSVWRLSDLTTQTPKSVIAYGAKSANLGFIAGKRNPQLSRPRWLYDPVRFL